MYILSQHSKIISSKKFTKFSIIRLSTTDFASLYESRNILTQTNTGSGTNILILTETETGTGTNIKFFADTSNGTCLIPLPVPIKTLVQLQNYVKT